MFLRALVFLWRASVHWRIRQIVAVSDFWAFVRAILRHCDSMVEEMMKGALLVVLFLLVGAAWATPFEAELSAHAKKLALEDECSMSVISKAGSSSGKFGALSVSLESCGGGNNWSHVALFSDGKKIRSFLIDGTLEKMFFDDKSRLVAESVGYAPADPRCCPTVKKKVVLRTPNGLSWDELLAEMLTTKDSCRPDKLYDALSGVLSFKKMKFVDSGKVLPSDLHEQSKRKLENKGDHSVVTVVPSNASLEGFPVTSISLALGHENGIGYLSVSLLGSDKEIFDRLSKFGLKKGKNGDLTKSYSDDFPLDIYAVKSKGGVVELVCDYSN